MFTNKRLVTSLSCGALLVGLMGTSASALTLTWDHDADGAPSDGSGTWLDADQWLNGATPATWNSTTPDDAIIGSGGTGGTIDLTGGVTVGTVTFGNHNGTYQLSNGTLTVNNELRFTSTSATSKLKFNSSMTLAGSGDVLIDASYPTGKETNGLFDIFQLPLAQNTLDGTYNVVNGVLFTQHSTNNVPDANSTVVLNGKAGAGNGAVYSSRWVGTLNRTLGTGAGQIQVTGNRSGFEGQGSSGFTVRLNNDADTPIVWGSANFDPNVLILQSPNANTNGKITFNNTLDLNGADRTISVDKDHEGTNGYALINKAIRNDGVGAAGLIKEGPGQLWLSAANTYDGDTTVNGGILRIDNAYLADGSDVLIADGAVMNLNFVGTDTINALFLDGVQQAAGVYDAASNPTFFTGGGSLTVTVPEPGTLALLGLGGLMIARRRRG